MHFQVLHFQVLHFPPLPFGPQVLHFLVLHFQRSHMYTCVCVCTKVNVKITQKVVDEICSASKDRLDVEQPADRRDSPGSLILGARHIGPGLRSYAALDTELSNFGTCI